MPTGENIIQRVRQYIIMSYVSLPLILLTFSLFVGLSLGNIGFLLFAAGQILLLSFTWVVQYLLRNQTGLSKLGADISQLVPSAPVVAAEAGRSPTYWLTFMFFFFSYIVTNASFVFNMDSTNKSTIEYENRRAKAVAIMVISALVSLSFVILRTLYQDLETWGGLLLAAAIGVPAGVGWYYLSNLVGIRHADIFGVVTQIIPKEAAGTGPKTCFYVASAS
jgi:hypothetical protein